MADTGRILLQLDCWLCIDDIPTSELCLGYRWL